MIITAPLRGALVRLTQWFDSFGGLKGWLLLPVLAAGFKLTCMNQSLTLWHQTPKNCRGTMNKL
jgi:hypothetical protein